eukprot:9146-Eustigmatos_ZCMA.PRE.1
MMQISAFQARTRNPTLDAFVDHNRSRRVGNTTDMYKGPPRQYCIMPCVFVGRTLPSWSQWPLPQLQQQ